MARSLRSLVKSWFQTGDVPTQTQYSDTIDSSVYWEDDIEHTLTNDANKVPASDAVFAAIGSIPSSVQSVTGSYVDNTDPLNPIINVPTLEDVNDAGGLAATNSSKYGDVTNQLMLVGFNNIEYQDVVNGFNTVLSFDLPTVAGGALKFPDTAGTSKTLATTDQIPSGGGSIPHATASGTDTYTATISGVTSYNDGDAYLIRFPNGNTTGATLNINSIGARSLYRNNDGALIGGDIISGGEMLCVYNST
jgi:hypothetical protein